MKGKDINLSKGQIIQLGGTARSPEDVAILHEMGLCFAEVPITRPDDFAERLDPFRKIKEGTGLFFLCHGPREGDPNDIRTLESVYLPKLDGVLSLMPALGMRLLTVHLWMDARFVKREALEYKIALLDRLTTAASDRGITICLENLSERAEDLDQVADQVPRLMLTLDLGHAQLLTGENTAHRLIEHYPGRIGHIHLHDNRGGIRRPTTFICPWVKGTSISQPCFRNCTIPGTRGPSRWSCGPMR